MSDAPVRLPGKALYHVFERPSDIIQNIRKFYVTETLKQIYKIVGSLDLVGNPTMLISSVVSGVRDLVVTPSMTFWKSPTDPSRVGLSVAQGALSLLSHSSSGFFSVLAKIASRAGQGVAILSFDHDFIVWHRNKVVLEATNLNRDWKRRGVQKVEQMISRPLVDIVHGIAGGISGVFISPVKGFQQKGSVGFIHGVAIGGVGLIAKPTVGIMDALTHFTSSIHDIAKSVNVLDKRHQPAIRLRMPYTFGVKSILSPYNPIFARAAYLLKSFPITKSKLSLAEEAIVHTEVLSSNGIETYVIITTVRIIHLKVKKTTTGVLSALRCWEVFFSSEASISSTVTDHGHNGVAMTLLQHKQNSENLCDPVEMDSSDAVLEAQSDASKLRSLSQRVRLTSPHEQPHQDTADSSKYNHGLQRDEHGKLIEWYTIVAEFQYRSQLTILHNAISCIQGHFNAIIHDTSLSQSGSSSLGFTSFGMFYFEQKHSSIGDEEDVEYKDILENLPWVPASIFGACQEMSGKEQITYLANVRKCWTFEDELKACMEKAAPFWLVMARAEASFGNAAVLSKTDRARSNVNPDESLVAALDAADHHVLPARESMNRCADNDSENTMRREIVPSSVYVSALQLDPLLHTSEIDTAGSSNCHLESTFQGATTVGKQAPESSHTAIKGIHGESPLLSLHSTTLVNELHEDGRISSNNFGHEQQSPLSIPDTQTPTRPSTDISWPSSDHSADILVQASRETRIVRMERLMERLLIFSAEQALSQSQQQQSRPPHANVSEVAILRQEVAELRKILERQMSNGMPNGEVTRLCNEMALLRAQMGLQLPDETLETIEQGE